MSFMKPAIYKGTFYLVDGPCGTELIPGGLVDLSPMGINEIGKTVEATDMDEKAWDKIELALRDYLENSEIWNVELKHGYYGRYSAPGYMDATSWHWGDSEKEVRDELDEAYGEDNQ